MASDRAWYALDVLLRRWVDHDTSIAPAPADPTLGRWGDETLDMIERNFGLPGNVYRNEFTVDQPRASGPAFLWGAGVQLRALVAATRIDPVRYARRLSRTADAIEGYWVEANGVGGYDVLPGPKPVDRYYDDNAWIVRALAEAYEVTGDGRYLDRAVRAFPFLLHGEDDRLGGGIYWHETKREAKHMCSTAPTADAALRLYAITNDPAYVDHARRLVAWAIDHVRDSDGLFWDNIKLDGTIDRTKWSYNSALMLEATTRLWHATGEATYRAAANEIMESALRRWIDFDTGAIRDEAQFAHFLAEAMVIDPHMPIQRSMLRDALTLLHERGRDPHGWYTPRWDAIDPPPLHTIRLIDQASAARAFFHAAAVLEG